MDTSTEHTLSSLSVRRHRSVAEKRRLVEETLAPGRLAGHGFFNPETVARLRTEHATGRHDHAPRLWAILLAARWMERSARPAAQPTPVTATGGGPDARLVG